jgi:hypothetical protein
MRPMLCRKALRALDFDLLLQVGDPIFGSGHLATVSDAAPAGDRRLSRPCN